MLATQSRAAITGYCAAHWLLNDQPRWTEYSAGEPPLLERWFDGEISAPSDEFSGQWWERFFACGIIAELTRLDLWERENGFDRDLRVGICFGSSKGRPAWNEYSFAQGACDWALGEMMRSVGASQRVLCPVAACATGAHAIAIGAQWIEDGYVDVVLCGALEDGLSPLMMASYGRLGALSKSGVIRPFDSARDGFVPKPGAAMLVLENENMAASRRHRVLGTVTGWSLNCDATSMTGLQASGESIARAIETALLRAGRQSVDAVNAHGTATRLNDEVEARALERVLGGNVPVCATKSLTGHTLGAAGAIEAVLSLLSMEQKFLPPVLNLADKECELDLVMKAGRKMEAAAMLSLSYGFGGHIGALVLER